MVSLLAITFLVELTIHLVNTIGATTINNLVCRNLPSSTFYGAQPRLTRHSYGPSSTTYR